MKRWALAAIALLTVGGTAQAESELAERIKSGDRRGALGLIQGGADVNATQPDGTTPLHWAVYNVDLELTRALLDRGARADVRNNFGATPLGEAVKVDNVELVSLLLKAKPDVEAANADGQTMLMLAAGIGALDVAKLLVRAGANVNAVEQWRSQTALMWAAAGNHPDMVEFLISKGARVNVRAAWNDWPNQITSEPRAQYRPTGGLTPLLYASRSGCERCVRAMIKAGADVNMPNPDGVTPLMTAIDNTHYDVAKYLLEQGANPHVWDWWGRTALYIAVDVRSITTRFGGGAAQRGGRGGTSSIEMIKLLLDAGVNRNPQLNMHRPGRGGNSGRFTDDLLTAGCTPLLRAAVSYDEEAIRILLDHGALVDLPNVMGVTPFMAAAGLGVSVRDPRGSYQSPDTQARSIRTMKILLEAGADVNARVLDTSSHTAKIARPSTMTNRQGQTALYGAINWGWTDVVRFLLENGASVDIQDAAGRTPLDATRGNAGGRDHNTVEEVAAMIRKASAT